MKIRSKAFRLVLLVIWSSPALLYAQGGDDPVLPQATAQTVRFEHLTTEQGLSSNLAWSVVQDNHGFIWIGTVDGLNRYDGNTFKIYRYNAKDPNSLGDNSVRTLAKDSAGNIWVGSWGGGLNKFDPSTEQFTRYKHDPNDPHSLGGNVVFTIYEDQAGVLWVGTAAGLDRLDRETNTFTHYRHDPDDPRSLSHDGVHAVYAEQSGDLWIGTNGGGLNRLDPGTGEFTHYRHDPADPNSLSSDRVAAVYQDTSGIVWIGTWDQGLNRFDPESGQVTTYQHDPDDPSSLESNEIRAIDQDRAGALWVGGGIGGLARFDPDTEKFVRHQHDENDPSSLSHNGVVAIYGEPEGALWIATAGGGVNRLDPSRKPFALYRHSPTDPGSLSNSDVRSLYVDHVGALWVGTVLGLNRFRRPVEPGSASAQFTHYLHDRTDPQGLNGVYAMSLVEDQEGALWVGTVEKGLLRFDRDSDSGIDAGRFTQYQNDPSDPHSLQPHFVRDLYVDSSGTLWVGTLGGGLAWFDSETEKFHRFQHDPDNPKSLSDNSVVSILEDNSGKIWVATLNGINCFIRETEEFVRYPHDPNDPDSLSHSAALDLFEDREGVLWIGTIGGGLNRFDSQDERFIRYTKQDGLPSEMVTGITQDDQGFLWLSTSQGLSKFDPRSETFRNYDAYDGLQGNQFNINSVARSSSGELFFGGVDGFNGFLPTDIKDSPTIPPIVITDFQLANSPVEIGEDSVLQKSIIETKELVLSHDDQVISFEFAALNYSSPEKNRYRYKLEGFDEEWTEVGSDRRFVTYTNLDPGKYTFRVTGSNSDAVWNEEGTSLKITVIPPWWATWWFRGLVLVLLAAVGFGAYSWRTRSLRTRQRELEAEVEERRAAERALAGQLAFERLLAELSTTFVNLPPEQIDRSIQEALEALAQHLSHWGPHPRSCSLIIYRQDLDRFLVTHHSTEMPGLPPAGSVLDEIVPWFAGFWRRGETVAIRKFDDIPPEANAEREIVAEAGIQAVLFATFSVAGGPAGALAVNDLEEETVWDERTIQSIRLVGELLGNALERQRAVEEIQRSESRYREQLENQVAERTAELETLLDLSGSVVSTLDLDPLLDLILDELRNVVDYDGAVIRRLSGGRMELLASRLTYEDVTEPARYLPVAGVSALEEMVEHGTAFFIGDIEARPGLVDTITAEGDARMEMLLSRTHSWLGLPLIVKDDVIGMLSIVHSQPHHYDQETVSLAQAFANQAAIAIENAQLYARAQEMATLEERTRLARELHDSATQALYSALLFSETGKKLAAGGDLAGSRHYQERAGDVIQQALKEMRLLVYELRPPELEAEGLAGALQMRLDAVESRVGMEARLITGQLPALPVEVVQNLYRIALEALNNVLKHARADSVMVTLRSADDALLLEVADNGQGFDPDAVRDGGGLGLIGIQERVQALGGKLVIDSSPERGTNLSVRVEVPS